MRKTKTGSCRMHHVERLKMKIFRKMWRRIDTDSFVITEISRISVSKIGSKNYASTII